MGFKTWYLSCCGLYLCTIRFLGHSEKKKLRCTFSHLPNYKCEAVGGHVGQLQNLVGTELGSETWHPSCCGLYLCTIRVLGHLEKKSLRCTFSHPPNFLCEAVGGHVGQLQNLVGTELGSETWYLSCCGLYLCTIRVLGHSEKKSLRCTFSHTQIFSKCEGIGGYLGRFQNLAGT